MKVLKRPLPENKNLEIVLNYEDELKKFAELNMEREAG